MKKGVIIVEGNIGAGKSTFAQALAKELNGEYIAEPADGTNPYLELYYQDPARWAFEMQIFLLSARFRAHRYACASVMHKGGFYVMDRSYYGDVCFANVQKEMGYFTDRDYKTYLLQHRDMQSFLPPPNVCIYLDARAEVCKARIDRRLSERAGRACESGIDMGYLRALGREIDSLAASLCFACPVIHERYSDEKMDRDIQECAQKNALLILDADDVDPNFWIGMPGYL
jgi:deoxyadenosine/deoxycytidine kinase